MTARYQQFVDGIRRRAALDRAEDAGRAAVDVIEAVAARLDGVDRAQLAAALPDALRDAVRWDVPAEVSDRAADLVRSAASAPGASPERARYLVQAVLSELAAEDRAVADMLRHRLPDEFADLFAAPEHAGPAGSSAAAAASGPRPLDADELGRALAELENWSGTTAEISREVSLPDDRWQPLLARVHRAEAELSHHARVEHRRTGLVFALRTDATGSVTELDLTLARRIDDAVARVSSGG